MNKIVSLPLKCSRRAQTLIWRSVKPLSTGWTKLSLPLQRKPFSWLQLVTCEHNFQSTNTDHFAFNLAPFCVVWDQIDQSCTRYVHNILHIKLWFGDRIWELLAMVRSTSLHVCLCALAILSQCRPILASFWTVKGDVDCFIGRIAWSWLLTWLQTSKNRELWSNFLPKKDFQPRTFTIALWQCTGEMHSAGAQSNVGYSDSRTQKKSGICPGVVDLHMDLRWLQLSPNSSNRTRGTPSDKQVDTATSPQVWPTRSSGRNSNSPRNQPPGCRIFWQSLSDREEWIWQWKLWPFLTMNMKRSTWTTWSRRMNLGFGCGNQIQSKEVRSGCWQMKIVLNWSDKRGVSAKQCWSSFLTRLASSTGNGFQMEEALAAFFIAKFWTRWGSLWGAEGLCNGGRSGVFSMMVHPHIGQISLWGSLSTTEFRSCHTQDTHQTCLPQTFGCLKGTIPDLTTALNQLMDNIPQHEFAAAMERYPDRLRHCIAAEGHYFEQWKSPWMKTGLLTWHSRSLTNFELTVLTVLNSQWILFWEILTFILCTCDH